MQEIITNEAGGKQSKIESRITEVPPLASKEVGIVMGIGAVNYPREEDGTPNWHKIDSMSNLDHAMEHVANFLAERNKPTCISRNPAEVEYRSEARLREELSHATARMMMAMEMFIKETE